MENELTTNALHQTEVGAPVAVGILYPTGWVAPSQMTWEEWALQGSIFQDLSDSLPWVIGDWLNEGERRYGETYTQATKATGQKVETLKQYKWVTAAIPKEKRYPADSGISFTHHRLVAKLPQKQRDAWLAQAYAHQWSSAELAERLRRAQEGKGAADNGIIKRLTAQATPLQAVQWLVATFDSDWRNELIELLEGE